MPQAQVGTCLHRFLDEVVRLLSGTEGVFSSRLAFVTPQVPGKAVMTCDVDGAQCALLTEPGGLNLLPAWDPLGKFLPGAGGLMGRLGRAAVQPLPLMVLLYPCKP